MEALKTIVGVDPRKEQCQSIEDTGDRISDLPDSLILHILSFLTMDDVFMTDVLSRRWRYLWTSVPIMDFTSRYTRRTEFVERSLILHKGSKIQRFCISFQYLDHHAIQVDLWIRFALARDVEEFHLDFLGREWQEEIESDDEGGGRRQPALYKLPGFLFKSEQLTALTLRYCDLNLPTCMCLNSLKTLKLQLLEFTSDMIKHLTSSCPLLEYLCVVDCNRRSDLNIFAENKYLKTLRIVEQYGDYGDTVINIYAPNVLYLELVGDDLRSSYFVKNLSSLVQASFDFEDLLYIVYDAIGIDFGTRMSKILGSFHHAKVLKLCGACIQVLCISMVRSLDTSIEATHMELKTGLEKWGLPGFVYLLRCSYNLETLIINIDKKYAPFESDYLEPFEHCSAIFKEHDFDVGEFLKSQDNPFSCLLQHLKTIKIRGFLGGGRGFSRHRKGGDIVEEFLEYRANEIDVVKFLLNNSRFLETMHISTTKRDILSDSQMSNLQMSSLHIKLVEKLLAFPRASPDANIIFSER